MDMSTTAAPRRWWSRWPRDWDSTVTELPAGALVFTLRHGYPDTRAAGQVTRYRCEIQTPGISSRWIAYARPSGDAGIVSLQWPREFPGAPPRRADWLVYEWAGLDRRDRWRALAHGEHLISGAR